MNKKKILFSILLLLFILCGCHTANPSEGSHMHVNTATMKPLPIGPAKEFTLEDHINNTNSLLTSVTDSYQKMSVSATESSAPPKGVKAAKKVTKKYAERIDELKNTDFSTWSAEDLSALSLELSDIITAIRAARDLLAP